MRLVQPEPNIWPASLAFIYFTWTLLMLSNVSTLYWFLESILKMYWFHSWKVLWLTSWVFWSYNNPCPTVLKPRNTRRAFHWVGYISGWMTAAESSIAQSICAKVRTHRNRKNAGLNSELSRTHILSQYTIGSLTLQTYTLRGCSLFNSKPSGIAEY